MLLARARLRPWRTGTGAEQGVLDKKDDGNKVRDEDVQKTLPAAGWEVVVLWECEIRDQKQLVVQIRKVGYPFDSGDHNILWLAIGGPRKGLPIAPRFQACDGHGACVILDRPETQPRGPIACRPASGAPGCILGAVCWRPWIDQTTTPRGYLSQVDTPFPKILGSALDPVLFPPIHWDRRKPILSGCRSAYPCPTTVTSILPVCTCSLSIPLNERTSCSTSLGLSTRKYRNWCKDGILTCEMSMNVEIRWPS